MTDQADPQVLAERLEQLRRAAIALLEVANLIDLKHRKPYLDHAKNLQDIASELAALRQRPPEERPESPVLAFQAWATEWAKQNRRLEHHEYQIAQAAFYAAHPGMSLSLAALSGRRDVATRGGD
jgi:hypothetical protein